MDNRIKTYNRIAAFAVFIALPVFSYMVGDFARRTLLKEIISLLTILAFFMMLMQFYLSRANRNVLKGHKMSKVLKWHKAIGYTFVTILLIHPFLIVVPRYFEAGISPMEAFFTLITTFNSLGVILGMVAWVLMLLIGITSLLRNHLPFSYKTWRVIHGILSMAFITVATWHAIDLGRHTDNTLSTFLIVLAVGGILLLLRTYFTSSSKKITQ